MIIRKWIPILLCFSLGLFIAGCPAKNKVDLAQSPISPAVIAALDIPVHLRSTEAIGEGLIQFKIRCTNCHGFKGEGTYKGPSLQAKLTHSNGEFSKINHTIFSGIPGGGMPGWGKKLTPADIEKIAAYVVFMREARSEDPQ